MSKIRSLIFTIFISIFALGILNLFVLDIDNKLSHIPEMKTEVLISHDIEVNNIFGYVFKPMKKVEVFYIYNYFDGVLKNYEVDKGSEDAILVSGYKKVLLPMTAVIIFITILKMFMNSFIFGNIFFKRKENVV